MTDNRFDTMSRLIGQRLSRRTALRGNGAGLAGAALAAPTAVARTGTPEVATPATIPTDPHPGAGGVLKPEFLFTQAFENGTWAPMAGEEHAYTLTLTGASAQTVYFSDRPERIFGVAPTQQFLDNLGFSPDNPPNAALVAPNADSGEETILIIELLHPRYDASSATLTYDARVLADYHEDGLAHAATRQQDYQFSTSFEHGALFIDDCPDSDGFCYHQLSSGKRRYVGGIRTIGHCWKGVKGCPPCDDDYKSSYYGKLCHEAYPDKCLYGPTDDNRGVSYDCYVEPYDA